MKNTWKDYFERTKEAPPRPLLVRAVSYVEDKNQALDLGSGALNDSVYLIDQNFEHVTAVDKIPVAKEIGDRLPPEKFTYVISSFEDYQFPADSFDLINAQFSLPFTTPESFEEIFGKIYDSLKNKGIFSGQLFGDRDEWKQDAKMNFHTKADVEKLLSKYTLIDLTEEEKNKITAAGAMKHWHVFHFIVQK
jgi:SAM-dependent methyltransferase